MVDENANIFKTNDTPLAAYLVTEGYLIVDTIIVNGITFFLFPNDDPKIQELIKDFQLLRASTNASQIIYNYQELVKRIRRGL